MQAQLSSMESQLSEVQAERDSLQQRLAKASASMAHAQLARHALRLRQLADCMYGGVAGRPVYLCDSGGICMVDLIDLWLTFVVMQANADVERYAKDVGQLRQQVTALQQSERDVRDAVAHQQASSAQQGQQVGHPPSVAGRVAHVRVAAHLLWGLPRT